MEKYKPFKFFIFTVVMAAFVMTAATAGADSKGYKNYGRLGGGVSLPTEDLDDDGYDAGINMVVAYGRYLGKYLVFEGGFNYFFAGNEFRGSTVTAGNYDRDDYLSVSSILITVKGELPLGPVKLFAGGGVGAYFAYLKAEIDTQYLGSFDVDDEDSVGGVHVVAGGYYDITPQIFLGIEGLYRWTDEVDMNETVGTVPVNFSGDLNGYSITFTGGFRF